MKGVTQNNKGQEAYVLWLPSWYPNKFDSFLGDFVQRHAIATSNFYPVTVFHIPQLSEISQPQKSHTHISTNKNLKEIIYYLKFKTTRFKFLDKLRYNFIYYKKATQYLTSYFEKHGLPELVHVHVPMKAGNIARWIKMKYKINYIVSEHSSGYMASDPNGFFKKPFLHQQQVKAVFKNATSVTNVSGAIAKILIKTFKLPHVHIIYNTVDIDYFNYSGVKEETFTFIHVSTLTNQKNIKGILKTFGKYAAYGKKWKLKLVGPYSNEVVSLVQFYKLQEYVELKGEVTYQEVAMHMRSAHVFVLFSLYENFPCVVIEALCCGLPVISSNIAGINEAVNETNGILVESENEIELLEALLKIQKEYNNFHPEVISANAISRYSYSEIGKQIFGLYNIQYP